MAMPIIIYIDSNCVTENVKRRIMNFESKNITAVAHRVSVQNRWHTNEHKGGVIWFIPTVVN
jgi:hypothetical protein